MRWIASFLLLAGVAFGQDKQLDYQRDVHPLLAAKCFACHGGDKRSGGLSLRDYESMMQGGRSGAIVQPESSAESLIMRRVRGEMQPPMPPVGPRLTAAETSTLRTWIDEGARRTVDSPVARRTWTPTLALSPPQVPDRIWQGWSSPADRILASYFVSNKRKEPALVSDAVFVRRAYLDIWGIVPPPETLREFKSDASPDKRARLVDTLLAQSTNYRDHWISFWNDLLRNDEGVQYGSERKSISAWLGNALETNMPYDRLLAGLLNPSRPGDPEGFLAGVNWRGDVNASQTPAMQAAQNTAQVFLGINLKCASCHDSFVSRWKLRQSYGLAAYFAPEEKLQLVRCDVKTGESVAPAFLFPELALTAAPLTLAERHAEAARLFTDPRNGRMPRTFVNRIWQRLLGRGLVESVDDMDAEPWSPQLLDWLASDFVSNGYDIKRLIRTIMLTRAYQLPAVAVSPKQYTFGGPSLRRMTAEQFLDSIGIITGEWRTAPQPVAKEAVYARESRLSSNSLSRALGRPLRDQVVTERASEATTLQALELVNGIELTRLLNRAARKMLKQERPSPAALFDSGQVGGAFANQRKPAAVEFSAGISQSRQLRLITSDQQSYAPEQVVALWADVFLTGPNGKVPLRSLEPRLSSMSARINGREFAEALPVSSSKELVYDIAGKGFTRIEGFVGVDEKSNRTDIMPAVRFFIFDREPDHDRLIPVAPASPIALSQPPLEPGRLVDWLFEFAFARPPSPGELSIATTAVANREPAALADLLWSIAMQPEFQLIR